MQQPILGPFSFASVLWVFTPGGNAEINATVAEGSLESNPNACLLFIVLYHLLLELWAVMTVVEEVNRFPRTIIMQRKPHVANSPNFPPSSYFFYYLFLNLAASAFKCIRPTVGN